MAQFAYYQGSLKGEYHAIASWSWYSPETSLQRQPKSFHALAKSPIKENFAVARKSQKVLLEELYSQLWELYTVINNDTFRAN